jgi:hypothetical protein
MRKCALVWFCLLQAVWGNCQHSIRGQVLDKSGEPLFGVSITCPAAPTVGTASDFSGLFQLQAPEGCDTICFAYIGFKRVCLPAADVRQPDFQIRLEDESHTLNEVSIHADDPISNKFSVVKLEKLDIYQNPVAAGDPLKAITLLPASTNADETADPALRGSAADRSRVVLNGVPIRSPVRNGQVNGLGNFSLFNNEIIQKLYVYASNPPLTFGNTSAGLVEVETNKELDDSQLQMSAGLAGTGALLSKKGSGGNFFQVYGNYQFAEGFLGLNRANMPNLIDFGTKDGGFHWKLKTGKRSYLQSFTYAIDEFYRARSNLFTYDGVIDAGKTRFFTINNWNVVYEKSQLRLSSLLDKSDQQFRFGNLRSDLKNTTQYYAVDYRLFLPRNWNVQFGANYNNWKYGMNNVLSEFYYAVAPSAPVVRQDTVLQTHNPETYAYVNREFRQWTVSMGLRCNIPESAGGLFYLSRQVSVKYEPDNRHRLLLSGGKYYNYSTPSLIQPAIYLLNSDQAALDYYLTLKKFRLSGAVFYKKESGQYVEADLFRFNLVRTFGLELMVKKKMLRFFEVVVSNTFLDQQISSGEISYRSASDFRYFTKISLQYENAAVLTAGLTYITRPGRFYTPVVGSGYRHELSAFEPVYDSGLNTAQYGAYRNLSFSGSRYFPMRRNALVLFLSISNILNHKNQASDRYNVDYSIRSFDYYQLRTVYFGGVFMVNLKK